MAIFPAIFESRSWLDVQSWVERHRFTSAKSTSALTRVLPHIRPLGLRIYVARVPRRSIHSPLLIAILP
jgi:hypothetical protein